MVTVVMVDLASATLIMDTMATLITGGDIIGHTGIRLHQTSMQRIPLLGTTVPHLNPGADQCKNDYNQ